MNRIDCGAIDAQIHKSKAKPKLNDYITPMNLRRTLNPNPHLNTLGLKLMRPLILSETRVKLWSQLFYTPNYTARLMRQIDLKIPSNLAHCNPRSPFVRTIQSTL